jgi:KDO2-lipid IV(A) lauroyltransferase
VRPEADKLLELRDLYRLPLWMAMKPFYAFAPVSLLFRVATGRGTLDFLVSRRRGELLGTLEHYLGESHGRRERRQIARRYYQFRRRAPLARLWPQIRNFDGAASIEIDGLHLLDEALARGKGAILLSAHYGYARMIKPILRSRGRSPLLVGLAPYGPGAQDYPPFFTRLGSFVHDRLLRLPRASSFDERWNETVGVDIWGGMNLRSHLAALERNETLIILADGRAAHALQRLQVLGIDVSFAPGAVSLARGAGAAALPAFVIDDPERRDPIGLRLVIYPPLELQVTRDANADLQANLRRFAAVYEEHVRRYPHNWHWAWLRDGAFENPN